MKELPLTLTKQMLEEFKSNFDYNKQGDKSISSIEDLVLVHKTKYPVQGYLKTQRDLPDVLQNFSREIIILNEAYYVNLKHERNTVHFTVNGEVRDHMMGEFSNSQYIIIIPGELIEKEKFIGGQIVDFYTNGSYELPDGAIILCPNAQKEEIEKINENARVIGYEGENADDYGNLILSEMGYKVEYIGQDCWGNQNDSRVADEILFENQGFKRSKHFRSAEYEEEGLYQTIHELNAREKIIKEKKLLTGQSAKELIDISRKKIKNVIKEIILKTNQFQYSKECVERLIDTFSSELESITESPIKIPKDLVGFDEDELYKIQEDLLRKIYEPRINEIFEQFSKRYQEIAEVMTMCNSEEKESYLQQLCTEFSVLEDLIYFSDVTSNEFYELLECDGITLTEEQKRTMVMIYQCNELKEVFNNMRNDKSLSRDMKVFIERNIGKNKSEIFQRLLAKGIEDKYISSKTLESLTEEEQKQAEAKIWDIPSETEEVSILFPTIREILNGEQALEIISNYENYETNVEIIKKRLGDREHFDYITEMQYDCDLGLIHEGENVGQYIDRMRKLINLINAQIKGSEEIDFSDIAEPNVNRVTIKELIQNAIENQEIRSDEIEEVDRKEILEQETKDFQEEIE